MHPATRSSLTVLAALVAAVLCGTSLGHPPAGPRAPAGPSPSTVEPGGAGGARLPVVGAAGGATPGPGAPNSWSGTTEATLLPNYNASLPGDLRAPLVDWQIGTPAIVPSSGTVWWPNQPVSIGGSPLPTTAPALLYNLSAQSFVGIDPLVTNTSAFAYDPATGGLYGTDPLNNTVEEIDPTTGAVVGAVYHVGTRPEAIAYDPTTGYLFVANAGSNSVAVINPLTHTIPWASVAVGNSPDLLADDAVDGLMYVGNGGSGYLSRLDVASPTTPELATVLTNGPARGLAFSALSDHLAVTTTNGSNLTVVTASNGGVVPATVTVGSGMGGIVATPNGATFLVANSSGATLAIVNASTLVVSSTRLTVGVHPTLLVGVASNGEILVWNNATRNVTVVSSTLSAVDPSPVTLLPEPRLLAYDPTSGRLFVGDSELPGIEVLDPFTGTTEAPPISLPSAPLALALDPTSSSLYVDLSGGVRAYNTTDELLTAQTAPALTGPLGPLALDSSSDLLWVGRPSANVLVALNATTLAAAGPVAHVKVSTTSPYSIVLDPHDGSLVVVNSTSGQLAEFNGTTGASIDAPVTAGSNLSALVWDPADELVYAAGDGLSAVNPTTMTVELPAIPMAPHSVVGGLAYEPTREAVYVGTWTGDPYTGTLTVFNGSSAWDAYGSVTVVPTGFKPASIAVVTGVSPSLPDSGTLLVANLGSGSISVVASPPQILSASFSPAQVDEGVATRLTVAASGGATVSNAGYRGLPTGCLTSGFSVACSPTEGGTFGVVVTVTDLLGESAISVATLTVASALGVSATVGPLPSHEADVGVLVPVFASAYGGVPHYSYSWDFGDGNTSSGASTGHAFEATGEYVVAVTVTDNGGGRVVNETVVDVVADPAVELSAAPSTTTDVDLTLALSATVSGGAGQGVGSWEFGDGTGATQATTGHAWQRTGLYAVNYTYADGLGQVVQAHLSILVNPQLAGQFSVTPSVPSPVAGTTFTYVATVSNGTSGYTVVWTFGDGSYGVGSRLTHAYGTAGSYTVNVSVLDAAGAYLNTTFPAIVVGGGPSAAAPLFGGGFGPSFVLGLVLGGAVAAIALFAAERTRRAGPTGPPSPYVPPPPPARSRP